MGVLESNFDVSKVLPLVEPMAKLEILRREAASTKLLSRCIELHELNFHTECNNFLHIISTPERQTADKSCRCMVSIKFVTRHNIFHLRDSVLTLVQFS